MFCGSLWELTEGIYRCLLSILMTTVSADNLNASGEAGWEGRAQWACVRAAVVLAGSEALQSWEWSLAGLPRAWGHLPTKGWVPTSHLKPTLPH